MTTAILQSNLKKYKGKTIDANMLKALANEMQESVLDFMAETGFEIWNGNCNYRMKFDSADGAFGVHTYDDPLHAEKVYKRLDSAIAFMQKQDEL